MNIWRRTKELWPLKARRKGNKRRNVRKSYMLNYKRINKNLLLILKSHNRQGLFIATKTERSESIHKPKKSKWSSNKSWISLENGRKECSDSKAKRNKLWISGTIQQDDGNQKPVILFVAPSMAMPIASTSNLGTDGTEWSEATASKISTSKRWTFAKPKNNKKAVTTWSIYDDISKVNLSIILLLLWSFWLRKRSSSSI